MADEKIITSSVFEQGITEIMQDIANNLYEFEEYTEEEVANLIDLSEEEATELTRVINDTTIALNKVYSNKKVEDLLSELEVTCNKYADEKIGGLAGIHLAYVDALPTTGEDNVIYILKSTTGGNDTLNLYNNGWISIGEFTISLDSYYDKAEVDTLLNDKANANEVISQNDVVNDMSNVSSSKVLSTAGLEVELNKKIDKNKIVTVLDDTATDEQVPSARLVYEELDKKIEGDNVVKKDDIVTVLDDTVTDEQVPSAKAVYDVYGELSVISPIKEGYARNSNGGGISYYKQIKNMVIVTCSDVSRLIYNWNIGAKINEGALPKPRIKIPVSIMSSNGEFYLAELDTDGYIKVKNREIPQTETGNIYYYSFNYITDEL